MFISVTSDVQMFGNIAKLGLLNYSVDLNSKLVRYSDHRDFFSHQMHSDAWYYGICYLDHHKKWSNNEKVANRIIHPLDKLKSTVGI